MRRRRLASLLGFVVVIACSSGGKSSTSTVPLVTSSLSTTPPASLVPTTSSTEPASATSRAPYVFDGDGAFDDLKALAYLVGRSDVDVMSVTMSGTGVAHCPQGARNASAVLKLLGASTIPVSCGRSTPLVGTNQALPEWRQNADTLGGMSLPAPGELSPRPAPELLADTIRLSRDKVVLVVLGPLTNIAEAIERDRGFLDNVKMLYLMGGAVDVGGNVFYANTTAEFNIWADPHAAAIVFGSGVPITLVPLDATNAVPVTPYFYDVFSKHDETAAAAFIASYLKANPLVGGLYQWDELAAVIATDERVAHIDERRLAIVESDGPEQGATVARADGRVVRVAVTVDQQLFEDRFFTTIIGQAPNDVPAWNPDATLTWNGTDCRYQGPKQLPERFVVELHNTGSETFAFATGVIAPGITQQDFVDYAAAQPTEPPPWWTQLGTYISPAGGNDVWVVRTGTKDATALCSLDLKRTWIVAGPTLPG